MEKKNPFPYRGPYFQKSRVFLFPLVGNKHGDNFKPVGTYIAWEGRFNKDEMKLVVVYKHLGTEGYKQFESKVLLTHPLFLEFVECEDDQVAYIFTFEGHKEDWFKFLKGRYSELSVETKKRIEAFFGQGNPNWFYTKTYLYPEEYRDQYAEFYADQRDPKDVRRIAASLRKVGELCDVCDLDKETLRIAVKKEEKVFGQEEKSSSFENEKDTL